MTALGVAWTFVFNYIPVCGIIVAFKRFNVVEGIWGSKWVGFHNFMLYPFIYILLQSISNSHAISSGIVVYRPGGINIDAYRMVFSNDDVLIAY